MQAAMTPKHAATHAIDPPIESACRPLNTAKIAVITAGHPNKNPITMMAASPSDKPAFVRTSPHAGQLKVLSRSA
ncbi:MAG: hypothetical protein NTW19_20970 [Planctomycetota bacterium]|nr:hypothetical protein [Planctomycetota bacterium]